jgi:hypothetical protein
VSGRGIFLRWKRAKVKNAKGKRNFAEYFPKWFLSLKFLPH